MKTLKLMSLLISLLVVASCGEDDEVMSTYTINISIDGVEEVYTLKTATLNHESTAGAILGSSLGFRFENGTDYLTPVYSMEDSNQSSPCMDEGNYESEGFGAGAPNRGFGFALGGINGETVIYKDNQSNTFSAMITSCDGLEDKVSGSFDFLVEEFLTDEPITYRVTGTFMDIPFIDIQ